MQITNPPPPEELDINVIEKVRTCLQLSGHTFHLLVEISAKGGVVLVQGKVRTFYLRQVAVECIKRQRGVIQVIDLIEVADCPTARQPSDNMD